LGLGIERRTVKWTHCQRLRDWLQDCGNAELTGSDFASDALAEAIRYALTRRASLERFLSDGRIELDSNTVEHAIRPQTITRKNSLFAGSDGGSRTWAAIASLLATVKMNNVDPHA